MIIRLKKFKKFIFLILLVFVSTSIYADPDPNLCSNPLNPMDLVDCNDIDLPLDNIFIIMGLTIALAFFMIREKVILVVKS